MSSKTIFLPKTSGVSVSTNEFLWQFGTNPEVKAEGSFFSLRVFPPTGEKTWSFHGFIGLISSKNYFAFSFSFPYIDDSPFEATFTLNDKLHLTHTHSSYAPPGFDGFTVVDADEATLTIKLDPAKNIATGDFEATFKTGGYRLHPKCRFNMVGDQP
ncbi:hypothetical protein [Pseudomonas syringae]